MTDSAGPPPEPGGEAEDDRAAGADAAAGGGPEAGGAAADGRAPGTCPSGDSDGDGPDSGTSDSGTSDSSLSGASASAPGTSGSDAQTSDASAPDASAPAASVGGAPTPDASTPDKSAPDRSGHGHHTPALPVEPKVAASSEPDAQEPDGGAGAGEAPRKKRHWIRWAALGTSLVVLAASGAAWWFYRKLDANITTDTTAAAELQTYEKERPVPIVLDAQNILLLGSDSRAGKGNSRYGRDDGGSQRADTAILLHIAADRQSSTAVSLPRDLMATIPACRRADGSRTREHFGQFNSAFEIGGAACTIRTVERMTGVRIDHHMVVDFSGFKEMVDAVDGVEVCLKEPVNDPAAKLRLRAGEQTLNGEQALGFVRARKSLGDGSDTERMSRQQHFLASLVKKVQSDGVLLNPAKLYPVLDAATKSLTTDPGLDTLRDLYDLARSIRSIPTEGVQFLTVPRQPYAANRNRDELVQPAASQLFEQLREDSPITVVPPEGSGLSEGDGTTGDAEKGADSRRKPNDTGSGTPSPRPSFSGTNAAVGLCE
ncbi:LCP family glycopolymer transferase [Streptomyces sp. NPDC004838]